MAAAKKSTKAVPRKAVKPIEVVDPVLEAENLLLEIEQAKQDIKDDIANDMIRAKAEHAAIVKKNAKNAFNQRYNDIDMAKKLCGMANECLRRSKVGVVDGVYKELLDFVKGQ